MSIAVLIIATTTVSAGPGLDLAIIVDRSTSMSQYGNLAPAALHVTARVLTRNAEMHDIEHRVAIVTFASSPSVDLPWTSTRELHGASISKRAPGGETDILDALQTTTRLFGSLPADPSRRRAIVLLTDGVPYVPSRDLQRYELALQRHLQSDIPRTGISLDVVFTQRTIASRWTALQHAAVHPTRGAIADILATTHAIVTALAGTISTESVPSKRAAGVDHIIVPPYLEMIVFDVFRSADGVDVDVFPPGSDRPLRHGIGGVEVVRLGSVLETLAVARPRPGEWIVRKSRKDARVSIRSQYFFPRGALLQPNAVTLADSRENVTIAYQVLNELEQPLDELPDSPLSLSVTIATPDGQKSRLAMERDASLGRAAFRATESTSCVVPGRYWTDVRVMTSDAAGRRFEVFRDRWAGFTVDAARIRTRAAAIPTPARTPARDATSRRWLLPAVLALLVFAGAVLRFRKTKIAARCLSQRSPEDEP